MTVIYWTVSADSSTFSTPLNIWLNVSLHLASTVFIFTEILSNSVPPLSLAHLFALELWFLLYLPIVYISAATLGFYPFTSLDPSAPGLLAGSIVSMVAGIAALFIIIQGIASSKLYLLRSNDKPTRKLSKKDPDYTESELPTHMPPGSRASSMTQADIPMDEKDSKVEIEIKGGLEPLTRAKSDSFSTVQTSTDSKSDILTAVMACTRMKSDSFSTVADEGKHDPDTISIIDCTRRKSDSVSTVLGSVNARDVNNTNLGHGRKLSCAGSIEESGESRNEPTSEQVQESDKLPAEKVKEEMAEDLPKEQTRLKSDSVSSGESSPKTDADTVVDESL
jgi:hypothetical protein